MKTKKMQGLTRRQFVSKTVKFAAGITFGATIFPKSSKKLFAASNNVLIFAQNQEPAQFNPLLYVNAGIETVPEACCFDALWDVNEEGKFIPNLATEVPSQENGRISSDGKKWNITLKKGVKWHDGKPFSAKDVDFTYKTIINPKVAVRSRSGMDLIEEFKILDENNIEITLTKPYSPFFWSWQDLHIVPEHILANEADINTSKFNTHPIGTGPFIFTERVAGSHTIYKRNQSYHRGAPKLETFIHKFVPDQSVLYTQFKTGEIDVLGTQGIAPERVAEAEKLPDRQVLYTPIPNVEFIYFNCGKPQFEDPRVRRAIYMAIDKQKWIDQVYYGTVKRTLSYVHSNHWAYNPNLKDYGYDPKKAGEILDAAGWKVGPDGIREKNGIKLQFSMSTTAGAKPREQAQQLVQQNLKDINVSMEIKNMPASVVWGEYCTMSKFDTLMVGWNPPVGVDPDYTARCHSKQIPAKYKKGSNYTQYENPIVDKLLEEGVAITDFNKRKEIYYKIQEILFEDMPFAPIFGKAYYIGLKSNVGGYKVNPYVADQQWNVQEWYVKA
jgi:peptide/nickel transport system substrate-binding protein